MLGGAIVVETIFTLPGLGRMTLDAVLERNYPVVQSGLLVVGAMFMLVNLATDVLYGAHRSEAPPAMSGRTSAVALTGLAVVVAARALAVAGAAGAAGQPDRDHQ